MLFISCACRFSASRPIAEKQGELPGENGQALSRSLSVDFLSSPCYGRRPLSSLGRSFYDRCRDGPMR